MGVTRPRASFTLVETVWALMIGLMILFTIGLVVQQLRRQLEPRLLNQTQLDNAMIHLSDDRQHMRYVNGTATAIQLTGVTATAVKPSQYWVRLTRHQLVLTTSQGGYMPLVERVSTVHFSYSAHCLTLTVTWLNQQTARRMVWLPTAEPGGAT
ncbi:competence type IV pilus minor pilin ComGF [Furfurilactobacillus sp. WILCCON 0119]